MVQVHPREKHLPFTELRSRLHQVPLQPWSLQRCFPVCFTSSPLPGWALFDWYSHFCSLAVGTWPGLICIATQMAHRSLASQNCPAALLSVPQASASLALWVLPTLVLNRMGCVGLEGGTAE